MLQNRSAKQQPKCNHNRDRTVTWEYEYESGKMKILIQNTQLPYIKRNTLGNHPSEKAKVEILQVM